MQYVFYMKAIRKIETISDLTERGKAIFSLLSNALSLRTACNPIKKFVLSHSILECSKKTFL